MSQQRLVEIFNEVVLKKDASQIQRYFHPGFVLKTNGQRQALATFLRRRELEYSRSMTFEVNIDEQAWVDAETAVGARLWLTVRAPGKHPEVHEIVLLARFVDERIHRMWELCMPARTAPTSKDVAGSCGPFRVEAQRNGLRRAT